MKKALFAGLVLMFTLVLMIATGHAWWFKFPKTISLWWRVKALEKTVAALEVRGARQHRQINELSGLVETLQGQNVGQQRQINRLSGTVETLEAESGEQQDQIDILSGQVTRIGTALALIQMNPVLDLGPYIRVEESNSIEGVNPPHVIIHNANVHIRSGSGSTDDKGELTGLGNLIVGYNVARKSGVKSCSDGRFDNEEDCKNAGETWALNHRTGSHNIVVGEMNNFSQYGGAVFGSENVINAIYASVTAGFRNMAGGPWASVSGGRSNEASGTYASVNGGLQNEASGTYASVSGGNINKATSFYASVSGGQNNMADAPWASIGGGQSNNTSARYATVSGGRNNMANGEYSAVSGGQNNMANGLYSTVSGGQGIEARVPGQHLP